jgi:hypothetical protein
MKINWKSRRKVAYWLILIVPLELAGPEKFFLVISDVREIISSEKKGNYLKGCRNPIHY